MLKKISLVVVVCMVSCKARNDSSSSKAVVSRDKSFYIYPYFFNNPAFPENTFVDKEGNTQTTTNALCLYKAILDRRSEDKDTITLFKKAQSLTRYPIDNTKFFNNLQSIIGSSNLQSALFETYLKLKYDDIDGAFNAEDQTLGKVDSNLAGQKIDVLIIVAEASAKATGEPCPAAHPRSVELKASPGQKNQNSKFIQSQTSINCASGIHWCKYEFGENCGVAHKEDAYVCSNPKCLLDTKRGCK